MMVNPIRPVPPRRMCPPGSLPVSAPAHVSGQRHVIVPPRVICVRPGFVTPFGGPASGISPSGFANSAPGSGAIVAPAPTPVPTCVTASIFADCFGLCAGVINSAAPGPVCGWTYIEPFGPLGGQVTFTPGVMRIDAFDADDFPIVAKPFSASLASVFGISGQVDFTEYQTPPTVNTTYQWLINNFDISQQYFLGLFGDGTVLVQAGDPSIAIPSYLGTWTPNNGAHVVHFEVDGAGIPTLWIDGVSIPLTFLANLGTFSGYPANSISVAAGSGDATPDSAQIRSIFITVGATAPETEFCCT